MIRTFSTFFAGVVLTGCPLQISGPQSQLDGLPEGLYVQLTVEPDEVSQHQPFEVRFTATNTTQTTVRVVTAHGCLVIPHVIRDGRRVPFKGSAWGCTAAITTHTFAPAETRSRTWEMRAELYAEHEGEVDGAPAPKGAYRVQAEIETYSEDRPHPNATIEAALRVR
jgi:hypothetical protein